MPVPVATDGSREALESRRVELRSLEQLFRKREEEALAAQRGEVGPPLDPDGYPISVTGAPVADVGEFLDPESAPPSPASGPTDVGKYMVPEERP